MSNICPVCDNESTKAICETCGFEMPPFVFLSEKDARKWHEDTVVPYRATWEKRKNKITCKNCGKELQEGWKLCPYCIALVENQDNNSVTHFAVTPESIVVISSPVTRTVVRHNKSATDQTAKKKKIIRRIIYLGGNFLFLFSLYFVIVISSYFLAGAFIVFDLLKFGIPQSLDNVRQIAGLVAFGFTEIVSVLVFIKGGFLSKDSDRSDIIISIFFIALSIFGFIFYLAGYRFLNILMPRDFGI